MMGKEGRLLLFRVGLGTLYLVSLAAILLLLARGEPYYATPLAERARHPDYWDWKSGGHIGHLLGLVGSAMMVLMLLYSVRKRVRLFRRWGPLGRWLDVHIFFGLVGPALVILHSAFKVQGLVALSFWSMIAVAASGVLGRYLYLQIPRTRAGEELTLRELTELDRDLSERLKSGFGLDDALLRRLEALSRPPDPSHGLVRVTAEIVLGAWREHGDLKALLRECRGVPKSLTRVFELTVRQKHRLHRRILLWDRLHALFHYWHVFHKPFAVVMYLFLVVHVAVALVTGYGWWGA